MFLVSKLVSFFFLPPGLFFVLLAVSIILFALKRLKPAIGVLLFTTALIYLLSTEVVSNALLLPLEDAVPYPKPEEIKECSVIVVLGGGRVSRCPSENFKSCVRPQVAMRLFEAFKVWKQNPVPIVVSGGKVFERGEEPESTAMKRFLVHLGVPEESIIEEGASRNTFENAKKTKELLSGIKPGKVCLVTSAFHMKRSVKTFEKLGIDVVPVPAGYLVERSEYIFTSYLPSIGNLQRSYFALHEYLGLIYYSLLTR